MLVLHSAQCDLKCKLAMCQLVMKAEWSSRDIKLPFDNILLFTVMKYQ